ncbi:hypothetical protein BT63DRAFT_411927 [Microthyrium microscopicum]|uniref:Uncharacterized protein n=1 Tax=Microthyrium microscopicum TaxID=703497 RepID=A0A6A6UEX9_9PEZI|nr:hypothetical protein BT63DRAFT_411927 [Microthyrium microscopicum]
MYQMVDHTLRFFKSLISSSEKDIAHTLPVCGVLALHEAYQKPIKRRRSYCSHDIRKICGNQDVVDRYIYNLSSYCTHSQSSTRAGSDYELALRLLEESCPNLPGDERLELKKRQASVALTTATTKAAPTTVAQITTTPFTNINTVISTTAAGITITTLQTTTAGTASAVSSISASDAASSSTIAAGSSPGVANSASGAISRGTSATGLNASGISTPNAVSSVVSGSSSTSTPVTTPSKIASLAISTEIVVPTMSLFASPQASVPNPIAQVASSTYSGQALLTATCAIPQYTAFPLADGSYTLFPVVGCGQANPECCPPLTASGSTPTITASIIPLSQANSELVSALNAAPLTLCPADYTSTASNCCPVGFSLYNQRLLNQTPCYTILSTSLPVPAEISSQISSLSAIIAATATAASASVCVNVITNQIFALLLPLKNGVEVTHKTSSLSLGAKIGIGVGAGLGALIALILLAWCTLWRRKDRRERMMSQTQSQVSAWTQGTGTTQQGNPFYANPHRQSMGSTLTQVQPGSSAWTSPKLGVVGEQPAYVDDETAYKPQSYVRPIPQRPDNMKSMPTSAQFPASALGVSRYTELPGKEYVAPVEADSQEWSGSAPMPGGRYPAGVHQQQAQQTYGQAYGQAHSSEMSAASDRYAAYALPLDRVEMDGGATPRPRWME